MCKFFLATKFVKYFRRSSQSKVEICRFLCMCKYEICFAISVRNKYTNKITIKKKKKIVRKIL